ncbi:hypothetical protein SAMN05192561_103242 [Halopenitus malekzadehii]|uniref:DUF7344 domain-containing protein n=2 Tax=Halopenitus malekzadehii TaxID=1267564 RepID=A0A1H6IV22_9EURY|nr:hypothetical protein SAMN05192561_103242 [Halopenitus malekzadehii]
MYMLFSFVGCHRDGAGGGVVTVETVHRNHRLEIHPRIASTSDNSPPDTNGFVHTSPITPIRSRVSIDPITRVRDRIWNACTAADRSASTIDQGGADAMTGLVTLATQGRAVDSAEFDAGPDADDATDATDADDTTGRELSKDTVFSMLSNRRRRRVIEHLSEAEDGRMTIRDLSEVIAAEENDVSRREVTYKQRKRVYTSLYQIHLPTLDDNGIVEYEKRSGVVELAPTASDCTVYLESVPDSHLSWCEYWLGLAAVSLAFVTTATLGYLPYFSQHGHLSAVLVVSTIALSAIAFAVSDRRVRL